MLQAFWAWVLSAFLCPFGYVPRVEAKDEPAPDFSKAISVSYPGGLGTACPVSASVAITAGHVAQDESPFRPPRLVMMRGGSAVWGGYLNADFASDYEDAGFLKVDEDSAPFPSWYEFAMKAPEIGERLWWVGYDWRKRKDAGVLRLFTGRVVSLRGGMVFMDTETTPGSSGSCVLNSEGKIVAVTVWSIALDDQARAAVFVGMYPPWFDSNKKKAEEK